MCLLLRILGPMTCEASLTLVLVRWTSLETEFTWRAHWRMYFRQPRRCRLVITDYSGLHVATSGSTVMVTITFTVSKTILDTDRLVDVRAACAFLICVTAPRDECGNDLRRNGWP